jgi:hypothetical protein
MTATEASQRRFKEAQTDALLVNYGIIRTHNARLSREWAEPDPLPSALEIKAESEDKRNPVGNALTSQQGREQANGAEVK